MAAQLDDLEPSALMDLESGAFKAKKAKKIKTPQETALAELKAFEKKFPVCILDNYVCSIQKSNLFSKFWMVVEFATCATTIVLFILLKIWPKDEKSHQLAA